MEGPELAARAKAGKNNVAAAALVHCSTNCLRVVGLMRESVAEKFASPVLVPRLTRSRLNRRPSSSLFFSHSCAIASPPTILEGSHSLLHSKL
jgi:hypothetical protein